MANLLIAEDDLTSAYILKKILTIEGHQVTLVENGQAAFEQIKVDPNQFDLVLTDWMMPEMNGIELIKKVRQLGLTSVPILIIITSLSSDDARNYALNAGADDYLAKPYDKETIQECIKNCLLRKQLNAINIQSKKPEKMSTTTQPSIISNKVPFIGVCIAASTGGPLAVIDVVKNLKLVNAAFFIVIHGPEWMLSSFVDRLQKETIMKVYLAEEGMRVESAGLYLAPGERHLIVNDNYTLSILNGPPINFVKPSADPLFESVAKSFGYYSVAVVMTGMGNDGTKGAECIHNQGGTVLVQDPSTCIVDGMPGNVINSGFYSRILPLNQLAPSIVDEVQTLDSKRKRKSPNIDFY